MKHKVVAMTVDDASNVDVAAKKLQFLKRAVDASHTSSIQKNIQQSKQSPQFQGGHPRLLSLIQYPITCLLFWSVVTALNNGQNIMMSQ